MITTDEAGWSGVMLVLMLLFAAGLYQRGVLRLWKRAGGGRGISFARYAAAMLGLLIVFIALLSPLDAWSETLFTAHMVQHVLLIFAAAPLIAFGSFAYVMMWAVSPGWAKRFGRLPHRVYGLSSLIRAITQPFVAWTLFVVNLWLWHIPLLYVSALEHPLIHQLEHATFLVTALIFWFGVFNPPQRAGWGYGRSALLLALTMLQGTFLSVLLIFSGQAWYAPYNATATQWGLTALEDQQIAGVVMWLPGGTLCTTLAVVCFFKWFEVLEHSSPGTPPTQPSSEAT